MDREGRRKGHRAHLSIDILNCQTANHSSVSPWRTGTAPPPFPKKHPPCPPPIRPLFVFGFWGLSVYSVLHWFCLPSFLVCSMCWKCKKKKKQIKEINNSDILRPGLEAPRPACTCRVSPCVLFSCCSSCCHFVPFRLLLLDLALCIYSFLRCRRRRRAGSWGLSVGCGGGVGWGAGSLC